MKFNIVTPHVVANMPVAPVEFTSVYLQYMRIFVHW